MGSEINWDRSGYYQRLWGRVLNRTLKDDWDGPPYVTALLRLALPEMAVINVHFSGEVAAYVMKDD